MKNKFILFLVTFFLFSCAKTLKIPKIEDWCDSPIFEDGENKYYTVRGYGLTLDSAIQDADLRAKEDIKSSMGQNVKSSHNTKSASSMKTNEDEDEKKSSHEESESQLNAEFDAYVSLNPDMQSKPVIIDNEIVICRRYKYSKSDFIKDKDPKNKVDRRKYEEETKMSIERQKEKMFLEAQENKNEVELERIKNIKNNELIVKRKEKEQERDIQLETYRRENEERIRATANWNKENQDRLDRISIREIREAREYVAINGKNASVWYIGLGYSNEKNKNTNNSNTNGDYKKGVIELHTLFNDKIGITFDAQLGTKDFKAVAINGEFYLLSFFEKNDLTLDKILFLDKMFGEKKLLLSKVLIFPFLDLGVRAINQEVKEDKDFINFGGGIIIKFGNYLEKDKPFELYFKYGTMEGINVGMRIKI